jgi:hypothetical protein
MWWRLKFGFEGKEKCLALGVYPEVSLKEAREKRDGARAMLRDGIDPSANRKARQTAEAKAGSDSFEVVAREWPCRPILNDLEMRLSRRRSVAGSLGRHWGFPYFRASHGSLF